MKNRFAASEFFEQWEQIRISVSEDLMLGGHKAILRQLAFG
jgi:hypothetical protein